MRKILLFISLFIFFIIPVKADTYILHNNFDVSSVSSSFSNINQQYESALSQYNSQYEHYFSTYINGFFSIYFFDGSYTINTYIDSNEYPVIIGSITGEFLSCDIQSSTYTCNTQSNGTLYILIYNSNYNKHVYEYFDSNLVITSVLDFELQDFYTDSIDIQYGDSLPKLKDLIQYTSWSDYYNDNLVNYTSVNLDNYDYVLLSLKNYNQSDSFQTNLQVKGQIGITPIYNYGQTSKDTITGSQVQDRCNVNYDSYTTYPFYILQSDLQNNAIFAVKECESGSSFKFDNTIFDITYVTSQDADNPTITINGNTYDVIPYDDLPSTATKNEEDNYIPGQSGSAVDTGGLDSAIKSAQNSLSSIWNTFTYFTDFIGLLFRSLPSELHTILLSAFVICLTLGIIKIFLGH